MKYKYPRTPHCPWSCGIDMDDVATPSMSHFEGHDIVVTEKRDGENTTLYRDSTHARSLDSNHHPSRDWVKRLHGEIGHLIPVGWRICGENLFAQHSLAYSDLDSYFEVFSIWDHTNHRLRHHDMVEWCALHGIKTCACPLLWALQGGVGEGYYPKIGYRYYRRCCYHY